MFATLVLLFPVVDGMLGVVWADDAGNSATVAGGAMGGIFGYLEFRRARLAGLPPQHPVDRLATAVLRR